MFYESWARIYLIKYRNGRRLCVKILMKTEKTDFRFLS